MKKVVVLGAGYAGLQTVHKLQKKVKGKAEIILVDKDDYHYETTELHEVASGTQPALKITYPIADIIDPAVTKFIQDEVVKLLHRHGLGLVLLKVAAVHREVPEVLEVLLVHGQQHLADEGPDALLVLAGGAHGEAAAHGLEGAAHAAVLHGVAHVAHVPAKDALVRLEAHKGVHVDRPEQLLAGADALVLLLPGVPVDVVIAELLREVGAEGQEGFEGVAVKGAAAGEPVHKAVDVAGHDVGEHIAPGGVLGEGGTALGHGGQGRLEVRQGPAHPVAHHTPGALHGANVELSKDLVELAVLLRGLEHVLHHARPAADLLVLLDVGPQVLQQPPGRVLGDGHIGGGVQDVGHPSGQNLGVHLGKTRAGVLAGVELRVVQDLDAVAVAGLVEVDDGAAHGVVQAHGGVGQNHLLRQGGGIGGRQDGGLIGGPVRPHAPLPGQSGNPTVGQEGEKLHRVAVDIRIDPGEDLLPLRRAGLEAVDGVVVLVVEEEIAAAGEHVVGALAQLIGGAPVLLGQVNGPHPIAVALLLLVVVAAGQPHGAVSQQDHLAPEVLPLQGEEEVLVLVQHGDLGIGVEEDIAVIVKGHAAQGLQPRLLRQIAAQLRAAELLARGIQLAKDFHRPVYLIGPLVVGLRVEVLRQVVVPPVDVFRHPQCAVPAGADIVDAGVAVFYLLGAGERLIVLQLHRRAALQGHPEEAGPVVVVGVGLGLLLAVLILPGVGLLVLLPLGVRGEIDVLAVRAALVDVLHLVGLHGDEGGHVDRPCTLLRVAAVRFTAAGGQPQNHTAGQRQSGQPLSILSHECSSLYDKSSLSQPVSLDRRRAGRESSALCFFIIHLPCIIFASIRHHSCFIFHMAVIRKRTVSILKTAKRPCLGQGRFGICFCA